MAESNEENATKTADSEEMLARECEVLGLDIAIHKDRAKKYCQMTVGSMFGEELASVLVDHMKADENDMIDVEGVMAPFTVQHWPREILSGVVNLLENSEELQNSYKSMLAEILNLKEEDVELLSCGTIHKAVDFIKEQLKNTPSTENVSSSELLRVFESKCQLLDDYNMEPEAEQPHLLLEEDSENSSS